MCVITILYNCGTQYSTERLWSSSSYPPDNHHSSDDVYWWGRGSIKWKWWDW